MNRRFLLTLASTPSLVVSAFLWLSAMPAGAATLQKVSTPMLDVDEAQVCVMSRHSRFNLVCDRVSSLQTNDKINPPIDLASDPQQSPLEFKFSDDESNAAIALFGCDCPACLNALRTMKLMATS
jgi:hypothetical protein